MSAFNRLAKLSDANTAKSVKWQKTSRSCYQYNSDDALVEVNVITRSVRFNGGDWTKLMILDDNPSANTVKAAALREYNRRYKTS